MKYVILAMEAPEDYAARTDPDLSDAYWASWAGYVAAIEESGIMTAGAGLQPPDTATTIRLRGGTTQVQDGPFADVKEHLGGVFVIDVPDLDTAMAWAARCPSAEHGSVEVRPLLPPDGLTEVTTADEELGRAHRAWFGRLVGWLFRMTGDLQLAEDAVSTAFAAAVPAWRSSGVPDSPEAWLRVAARNAALSQLRRTSRSVSVAPETLEDREAHSAAEEPIDERLGLLFVCAHPALDPRVHAPLMLQAVLGVDAARIASVFLVPPSTMGQRLSRAKAKIRDAGIGYRVPEPTEFVERLGAVLQAVYAAYGLADSSGDAAADRDGALRVEALRLATLLTELLPSEAETWGLHSLLLHTESRRPARMVGGEFVPLALQDTAVWSAADRALGDRSLRRASALGEPGRFQLEAAISAVHSARGDGIPTDWQSIATLYRGLLRIAPSIGATIGAASALVEIRQPREAVQLLDSLPDDATRNYQPYWVCRARVSQVLGEQATAAAALSRAVGLTSDPAVRRYLVGAKNDAGDRVPIPSPASVQGPTG